jgi:hypothetical protein
MTTPEEYAEKMAYAIACGGVDSLSDSEIFTLRTDQETCHYVYSIVNEIKRRKMLDSASVASPPGICDASSTLVDESIVFMENPEISRMSALWINAGTRNAVLEIKEWETEKFHKPATHGTHELIFQKRIGTLDDGDLGTIFWEILKNYGFPEEKIPVLDLRDRV